MGFSAPSNPTEPSFQSARSKKPPSISSQKCSMVKSISSWAISRYRAWPVASWGVDQGSGHVDLVVEEAVDLRFSVGEAMVEPAPRLVRFLDEPVNGL